MAITSTFYTGAVDNIAWAKGSGRLGFSYVAHGASDCKVSAVSTGTRTVRVAVGSISGAGITDVNDATVDIALPNVTSGSQWFMIVADRVWQTTNATSFTYIEGTATRQLPPRTVDPGVRDQQPLALVRIQAGQTLPQEIIDLRVIGSNNGVMVGFDELCLTYLTEVGTVVQIGDVEWTRTLSGAGVAQWTKRAPSLAGTIGYASAAYGAYSSSYPASIRYVADPDERVTLSGMVKRVGSTVSVGNGAEFQITAQLPADIQPRGVPVGGGRILAIVDCFSSDSAVAEIIYDGTTKALHARLRRVTGTGTISLSKDIWWLSLEGVSWLR
jgi:hypothetical protein